MIDTFKHKGLRKQLVDHLREKGIKDEGVLNAVNTVPRHLYLDNAFLKYAYKDQAFQIGAGQTISQPYTVAFQTELLDIKKGDKVIEIGTGSGYQTAVLCEMGAKVYSIERQRELYIKAKPLLKKLGYSSKSNLFYGDGYKGIESFAPYDKGIITCGAPGIPQAIVDQLKPGGKLVIPVGNGDVQIMTMIIKKENGTITKEEFGEFMFVPMLENKANGG